MKYKVFWCKVNKYYTDEWLNSTYLRDKSWVFIASCVVTDNAKRKWIKYVKQELKTLKNDEKIYISWCGAFEKWEENKEFFNIYTQLKDFQDKLEILPESPNDKKENNTPSININKLKNISNKTSLTTKKFLVIQWWCDSYCTFCLTVIKRWKHFYKSREDIVDEITNFEILWWKEVVLTWVNLCAWGLESTNDYKNSKFDELLEYILKKTDIPRIRISSLWPEFITDKTIELFKNKRIMPHFHFSIQSWSTDVLKFMKRHYDGLYMRDLLTKIKNIKRDDLVDVSIWADIIVWFPWETDKDFLDTYNLIKDFELQKIHAFPFSSHTLWESVPASFFKSQVNEIEKKQRLNKILELWEKIRQDFIKSQTKKPLEVLIETFNDWIFKWWTSNYIEITNENFEVLEWNIWKNEIVLWRLK